MRPVRWTATRPSFCNLARWELAVGRETPAAAARSVAASGSELDSWSSMAARAGFDSRAAMAAIRVSVPVPTSGVLYAIVRDSSNHGVEARHRVGASLRDREPHFPRAQVCSSVRTKRAARLARGGIMLARRFASCLLSTAVLTTVFMAAPLAHAAPSGTPNYAWQFYGWSYTCGTEGTFGSVSVGVLNNGADVAPPF